MKTFLGIIATMFHVGAALLAVLPCSAASGEELVIPLTVREPAGIALRNAPVTSGIPLPVGVVPADASFTLHEGDREVPVQVTPTVLRDGHLRWILLDFAIDLEARQEKRLELRLGRPAAQRQSSLDLKETDDAIDISTGPLSFRISRTTPFALLDAVQINRQPIASGAPVSYVDGKTGATHRAGKPGPVRVEYRGPQRVTVRVDGRYVDSPLGFTTRITAWAGRTDLRIQHTLANSNPEQVYYASVKQAGVAIRPAFAAARSVLDEKTGCVTVRSGERAILLCDRDFAADPPRKLVFENGALAAYFVTPRPVGKRFKSEHTWLYDLSHKTAELLIDFDPPQNAGAAAAAALQSRLLAAAPAEWYSRCEATGVGRFGTLEDEIAVYRKWGWAYDAKQLPRADHKPGACVRWEDNHYESEADSVEAMLLMFLRTGQRGFFDTAEAWARYHMDLQAWRTDGWAYNDGAIWFPHGGPQGTRPARKPANIKFQHWGKGTGDDQELWWLAQAKSCYCHFYGTGLVDYYLLTGEIDALEAALDLAETKDSEYRKHRALVPGKSVISDTRGFGRGFYLIARLVEVQPDNAMVRDLAKLLRETLWRNPQLDDRGFAPSQVGQPLGKKDIPDEMFAFMQKQGIRLDDKGGHLIDAQGSRWPIVSLGGTWQHAYVHNAADLYARLTGDEDLRDFVIAFGRFSARHMLSEKCRQTQYYAHMDIPIRGQAWDPWKFLPEHAATTDGIGCTHSGWYTRFFPDAIARAYSLTRDPALLERSKVFWDCGSKRAYQSKKLLAGPDRVGAFAGHVPPKDDSVLSTSRMFYEVAHPLSPGEPPAAVTDLAIETLPSGQVQVTFTAPRRAARYQLKCAALPIVADEAYDFVRDQGKRLPFWKAANLPGEPAPAPAGQRERFAVSVPDDLKAASLHWALRAYDGENRMSACSNVVAQRPPR